MIGEDKAKTEIIYNTKNVQYSPSGITIFINLHNAIYKKIYEDVKRIVEKKSVFQNSDSLPIFV